MAKLNRTRWMVVAGAVATAGMGGTAYGDFLPGEILKFQQLPLDGGVPIPGPYPGPFIAPNPFPLPPSAIPYPSPFAPFPGHDELSTATATAHDAQNNPTAWTGTFMADDFADRFTSPVVHVRWWGSYMQNAVGSGVKQFLISFESDVPVDASNPFSHPGTPLLNQIVTLGPLAPGSGTFTEGVVSGAAPSPDGPLFQYNAELNLGKAFPEVPNTVYWLKIVALVDPARDGTLQWGWHNRDWSVPDLEASVPPGVVPGEFPSPSPFPAPLGTVWHFQDDAVSGSLGVGIGAGGVLDVAQSSFVPTHYIDGVDGPTGIGSFSKDLAFELYTTPEPASVLVLMSGMMVLVGARRRR